VIVSVYLSVFCLSVLRHISGTTCPIFTKLSVRVTMAVNRASGGVAICCVLPVLQMTSYCTQWSGKGDASDSIKCSMDLTP